MTPIEIIAVTKYSLIALLFLTGIACLRCKKAWWMILITWGGWCSALSFISFKILLAQGFALN